MAQTIVNEKMLATWNLSRKLSCFAAVKVVLAVTVIFTLGPANSSQAEVWKHHVIDNSSIGADGVRLGDVNGDDLTDIATGWEEGGLVRVYLHPAWEHVKRPWPSVTVGRVATPEDAFFADINRDGVLDVVSCCEGREQTVYFHTAPPDKSSLLDEQAWRTEPVDCTRKRQMWMYGVELSTMADELPKLLVGSKGEGSEVALLAPQRSDRVDAWTSTRVMSAGWIMSLVLHDIDGDDDRDLVVSDRKGARSGVYWLEFDSASNSFQQHAIGALGQEVMFLDVANVDDDTEVEVVAAVKPRAILCIEPAGNLREPWHEIRRDWTEDFGRAKAVRVADFGGDGRLDVAFACEGAEGKRSGVGIIHDFWDSEPTAPTIEDIAGPEGVKFDRIELLDLDTDGDLDLLTCEEADNLGVIWYENPAHGP